MPKGNLRHQYRSPEPGIPPRETNIANEERRIKQKAPHEQGALLFPGVTATSLHKHHRAARN